MRQHALALINTAALIKAIQIIECHIAMGGFNIFTVFYQFVMPGFRYAKIFPQSGEATIAGLSFLD